MRNKKETEIYSVGTQVVKFSGKPFKSGLKINTIKAVVESPYKIDKETGNGVPAYTFEEDESVVDACYVTAYKETEK